MATKKPKSNKTANKSKSTKPKTAAKTAVKPVSEAPKTNTVEKKEVEETITSTKKKSFLSGFFAKKYEGTESILTIFKDHKFYGALLGEIIGSMFLTILLFTLSLMGLASVATYSFAIVAIFIAIYAFSKACLNPIITVGMMATRRISVIRGVMYIIAEIIGAWLGWLIINSFHLAGGDTAYDIPKMAAIEDGKFWIVSMIELFGAFIIAFFYARAVRYKRSVFTFAATIAGGLAIAMVVGYVISAAFVGLNSNFIFNPATALMFQIFPSSGDDFGQIIGGICQALSAYAIIPMISGVAAFYLADFTSKLSGEE